jgi:hypothetical protein
MKLLSKIKLPLMFLHVKNCCWIGDYSSCRLCSHPNAEFHTSAELKPTVVGLNQTAYGFLQYVAEAKSSELESSELEAKVKLKAKTARLL